MIFLKEGGLFIRSMAETDAEDFAAAFLGQNWRDRRELLNRYFAEQQALARMVLVAEKDGHAAGYLTLLPYAEAGPFAGKGIPEIKDFNVLIRFRRQGIGTRLMDCAEALAGEQNDYVCLGVGLYSDYGAAHRMYVKRGYLPDDSGVWHGKKHLLPNEPCVNDDDLNLYLIKKIG